MAAPCYNGPNPIKDDERYAIWKWAKENGIDAGEDIGKVSDGINQYFFGGQAKPEWINDILSGRKTPFRKVADDLWRKQYNRQAVTQQAQEIARVANMGPVGKFIKKLWTFPRTLAVAGHGIVFPITHAGDLVFRPASWGVFVKGLLRTYRGAASSAYSGRIMNMISRDSMYNTALRSGVDVGPKSHAVGLISNTGGKTGFLKAAARSWDMLSVMRFELWKRQMAKYVKPGMSDTEVLDIGKNLATWANHATGSGKGVIADIGGEALFGPKLTQAKINRLTVDPAKTIKTFLNWNGASVGERAAAMTRLSGATQFLASNLGFLGVNAGVLAALGSKEKINFTDPMKGDFLAMKGGGVIGNVPGLHTEIRTLAKILATSFASRKELKGESKFAKTGDILGGYSMAKLTPTIQRVIEGLHGQDWLGRPLPWSKEEGTENRPKLTYGQYAASIGPIPLSGPTGFVLDKLKQGGVSALDRNAIVKALIIGGLGAPGFHVHEQHTPAPKTTKKEQGEIRQVR